MIAWICDSCGAMNKQEEKPVSCLLCNRRSSFTQVDVVEKKDEASVKYEEALNKLEEYEEGTPKRKLGDYSCSCSKKD
ncbi:hypothetical protein KO361_02945 [Candidatus Woesearchaeota archaeon]|nr:hypothetical protein [Candidatus Woesearchaeota archaeon]